MPSREASLKVTLMPASFQAGLRRMGNMTKAAGHQMGRALKEPISNGLKSAKAEFDSMIGGVKDGLKTVATLGGAVTVGGIVKSAVEAEAAYAALAGQLRATTGEAVSQAQAQAMVERAADNAGVSIETMRESMNQLSGLGDLGLIEDAMSRTAKQAERLRVPVDLVARATSRVLAKGIASSADEAEVLLERMNDFGRSVLGVDPDEAIDPNDIAEFAAFANRANSSVEEMIFLLGKSSDQVKDLGSALVLIEEFGEVLNTKQGLKDLRKASGGATRSLDMTGGAVGNLFKLLETGSPKAIDALRQGLSAQGKASLSDLLGGDLEIRIATGKATKQEIRDFARKLREEMAGAGDAVAIRNRIEQTNADLADTSAKKMQVALNRLEQSFTTPRMIAAVEKLADKLPALADQLAEVVTLIMDNPWESLATVVGGRLALAFGGSLIQTAVANGVKALFTQIMATQAATAAGAVATKGATSLGLGGAIGAAGAGAGGTAAAAGTVATMAAGALAAGAVGYGVGTLMYKYGGGEEGQTSEAEAMRQADQAVVMADRAATGGSREDMVQAVIELQNARVAMKENQSILNTLAGTVASWTDSSIEAPGEMRARKEAEILAEETKLRAALASLRSGVESTASSMQRMRGAAGTTRGPMVPANPSPGASPVGG